MELRAMYEALEREKFVLNLVAATGASDENELLARRVAASWSDDYKRGALALINNRFTLKEVAMQHGATICFAGTDAGHSVLCEFAKGAMPKEKVLPTLAMMASGGKL